VSSVINRRCTYVFLIILIFCSVLYLSGCRRKGDEPSAETAAKTAAEEETTNMEETTEPPPATSEAEELTTGQAEELTTGQSEELTAGEAEEVVPEDRSISWDPGWEYADYSKIHESDVKLYYSHSPSRKEMVVAVNAGHGTSGGESEKTLNHPDGSGKVTGGTNSQGAKYSMAISSGMEFNDGTPEAAANLSAALMLKDALLEEGFDVLMIREEKDTRLEISPGRYLPTITRIVISLFITTARNPIKGSFISQFPMLPPTGTWNRWLLIGRNTMFWART